MVSLFYNVIMFFFKTFLVIFHLDLHAALTLYNDLRYIAVKLFQNNVLWLGSHSKLQYMDCGLSSTLMDFLHNHVHRPLFFQIKLLINGRLEFKFSSIGINLTVAIMFLAPKIDKSWQRHGSFSLGNFSLIAGLYEGIGLDTLLTKVKRKCKGYFFLLSFFLYWKF
jgi:hypothetical protein